MLVVTIELWPHGDASRKRTLGVATIANEGACATQPGKFWYSGEAQAECLGGKEETFKVACAPIERYPNPWRLLLRFLGEAFYGNAYPG